MEKVTDPKKRVTDPVVIKELQRQNIDVDYVEFHEDYSASHPYAKVYRDLKSNKMMQVISGLPKVRKFDGKKIDTGWYRVDGAFIAKLNLFSATVVDTIVELKALNDQPNGVKKNDTVTWNPQLFIDGVEQAPGDPELLPVDPINENYAENTIQWDYGVCSRRLRIIEGRIREKWIFTENPNGEIRIQHNQSGKIKLRLGSGIDANGELLNITVEDEDIEVFDGKAEFPVEIGASATFYPDADPESNTVDGSVQHDEIYGASWSTIVNGAGTNAEDSATDGNLIYGRCRTDEDVYRDIWRSIFLFNTSSLDNDCTIGAAVISLRGLNKNDSMSASPDINIYSSNPASNTAIESGDYDSLGSTALCDTPITFANFSTTDYNDFSLNTTGLSAIDKTGITKLGARNANYDVANTVPPWSSNTNYYVHSYFAEQGAGYKPKLVVTYGMSKSLSGTSESSLSTSANLSKFKLLDGTSESTLSTTTNLSVTKLLSGTSESSLSASCGLSGSINVVLTPGTYDSGDAMAAELQAKMNAALNNTYTVSFDSVTKKYTITTNGTSITINRWASSTTGAYLFGFTDNPTPAASIISDTDVGECMRKLSTSPDGESHTIKWYTCADMGNSYSSKNVGIRVTPYNAAGANNGEPDTPATLSSQTINNRPVAITIAEINGYTSTKDETPTFIATMASIRCGSGLYFIITAYDSDGNIEQTNSSAEVLDGWKYERVYNDGNWYDPPATGVSPLYVGNGQRIKYTFQTPLSDGATYTFRIKQAEIKSER